MSHVSLVLSSFPKFVAMSDTGFDSEDEPSANIIAIITKGFVDVSKGIDTVGTTISKNHKETMKAMDELAKKKKEKKKLKNDKYQATKKSKMQTIEDERDALKEENDELKKAIKEWERFSCALVYYIKEKGLGEELESLMVKKPKAINKRPRKEVVEGDNSDKGLKTVLSPNSKSHNHWS